jgi:hypothetical protein
MSDLRYWMKCLNRKERYWLISWAIRDTGFSLSEDFRKVLGDAVGLDIPADAYCAMDYHLDWIHASLHLAKLGVRSAPFGNKRHPPEKIVYVGKAEPPKERDISANQEDIDFVIEFGDRDLRHLVLVEAKGDSGFLNKQMSHKALRLGIIFGQNGDQWIGVKPYFAITSPKCPRNLECCDWPRWMVSMVNNKPSPIHVELPFPRNPGRVTRCDVDEKPDADGTFWTVIGGCDDQRLSTGREKSNTLAIAGSPDSTKPDVEM